MPKYRRAPKIKREKTVAMYVERETRTGKPARELHVKKHATFDGFDEGRWKREKEFPERKNGKR